MRDLYLLWADLCEWLLISIDVPLMSKIALDCGFSVEKTVLDLKTTSWVMTGRKSTHFNPSFNHVSMNLHIPQTSLFSYKLWSPKKRTLQTIVVSKSRQYKLLDSEKGTLQIFVVSKSGHYKLL